MILPLSAEDLNGVREIHRLCHPTWPDRPEYWYFLHPTLVAFDNKGFGPMVGFTSFSISTSTGLVLGQGADVCVHPAHQGRGLGRLLHAERIRILHGAGATVFSGTTQPKNYAMQRILEAQGLHRCQTIPRYFPDGEDALLYFGPIGD